MFRTVRRSLRRLQHDFRSLITTNRSSQSNYIVAGFVVSGIFIFAALHTIFNMVLTTNSNHAVGYFDLYGENLTNCWSSSFVGRQSAASWPATVAMDHSHTKQPPSKSIRNDIRILHKWNISTWQEYKGIPKAGECLMEVNSPSLFSSFRSPRFQCLPSFIIAGAMKCGTGELMKWLNFHPYLHLIENKHQQTRESHFFSRRQHFPTLSTSAERYALLQNYSRYLPSFNLDEVSKVYTFEKSPDYIRSAHSLQLILTALPNIKLIMILRNPVYRALSEFSHHCRHRCYVKLLESVTIHGIVYNKGSVLRVQHDSQRQPSQQSSQNKGKKQFMVERNDLPVNSYYRLSYPCSSEDMVRYFHPPGTTTTTAVQAAGGDQQELEQHLPEEIEHGYYEKQLQRLFDIFKDKKKENVLILLQEDMYKNTYRTLRKVEAFLGLPCFDYSQAAYRSDRDHPPTRRPRTIHERVHHYHQRITNLFGLLGSRSDDDDHVATGERLFKDTPKQFQAWVVDIFLGHNQALQQLLDKEVTVGAAGAGASSSLHTVDIKEAKWSL